MPQDGGRHVASEKGTFRQDRMQRQAYELASVICRGSATYALLTPVEQIDALVYVAEQIMDRGLVD